MKAHAYRKAAACAYLFQVTIPTVTRRKKNRHIGTSARISTPPEAARATELSVTPKQTSKKTLIHVAVLLAVSLAAYGMTLRNGFVTDDNTQILLNSYVKQPGNVGAIFSGDVWSFASRDADGRGVSNYYRPLQILVYAGEFALFGEKPAGWHAVNFGLNAAVVVAIYFLVAAMGGPELALCSALVFALHPMHVEAVAWIAALPELQCGLLMVMAIIFYHRARSGAKVAGNVAISTVAFAAALLSKETALLFPAILLSYEYFYREEPLAGLWRSCFRIWPYLLVLVAYIGARVLALGAFVPVYQIAREPLSVMQLSLAIPAILARYAGKLFVPAEMNYFYSFPIPATFGIWTIIGLAITVTMVVAMFALRKKQALLAFALAWFLLTLAPALNLNHIGENFFTERYLYIPSLGFSIFAAWGWLWLHRKLGTGSERWLAWTAGIAVLVSFTIQVERRIPIFHDNMTLLSDTVRKSPESAEALSQYASAMFETGDVEGAIRQANRSLELRPNHELTLLKMAQYFSATKNYDAAIEKLRRAVVLHPEYEVAWINLAKAYTDEASWTQAVACYHHLEEIDSKHASYYRRLAGFAESNEKASEGLAQKQLDAEKHPENGDALLQLGDAYARAGKWTEAANRLRKATKLAPANVGAWTKLGVALNQTGDRTGAINAFTQALAINPNFLLARQYLAETLAASDRTDESTAQFEMILAKNPRYDHADAVYYALGLNSERKGQRAEAIHNFEQALLVNPRLADAEKHLRALQSDTEKSKSK